MLSPPPDDRKQVLTSLREAIRRIERRPARREGVVPCGLAEVDAALPGGGFPRGAISELSGGRASGKTAVALSLLVALGDEAVFAWVDGRGELYPPAAAARGVDLRRLLIVRPGSAAPDSGPSVPFAPARPSVPSGSGRPSTPQPPGAAAALRTSGANEPCDPATCLWAAEALLGSSAFAAVVMDVPLRRAGRGWEAAARRLQTAAEKGGALALWLAPPQAEARVPAALRLELFTSGGRVSARRPGAPAGRAGAHVA